MILNDGEIARMSNTNCIVEALKKLTSPIYVNFENLLTIAAIPNGAISLRSIVAALEWVRVFSSALVICNLYNNGKSV